MDKWNRTIVESGFLEINWNTREGFCPLEMKMMIFILKGIVFCNCGTSLRMED